MDLATLAVQRLTVGVAGRTLLRDLSFTIAAGERLALTGPSGCGKTTLLRTIAHLVDPFEGSVRFQGQAPETMGYPAFRRQVVLVDQQPVMLDATVEHNLQRPFTYRHVGADDFPRDQADELLDDLGIGRHRLGEQARSFSLGEQQRIALVRALLMSPAVLLLDEPTSALDAESRCRVHEVVEQACCENDMAAIAVLHDTNQADRWCDQTICLNGNMA